MGPISDEYTKIGPGFAAFVVVFLLGLALWFLLRSMNARLRRAAYEAEREDVAQHEGTDGQVTRAGR